MTDPREFIERVDQVLAENDASKLPPLDEPKPITFTFPSSSDAEVAQLIRRYEIESQKPPKWTPEWIVSVDPKPRRWWRRGILGRPR